MNGGGTRTYPSAQVSLARGGHLFEEIQRQHFLHLVQAALGVLLGVGRVGDVRRPPHRQRREEAV